jgi:hypothetical protein
LADPLALELMMLSASYAAAAAAILLAAIYFFVRLRLFVTTTSMLVGSLLLIYGPLCLTFTLSGGEPAFLIQRLSTDIFGALHPHPIFAVMESKVHGLDRVITSMNFAIALMYLGIMTGIEAINWLAPMRAAATEAALSNWNSQPLQDDLDNHRILLLVISALVLFMLFVSVTENHVATIAKFFSIKEDNAARDAFRLHFAASPNYLYRLVLGAIAPMFVIWGLLAGANSRSWKLLLGASLLFVATMVGKLDILSKAPPAFFIIQLMVASLILLTNRISWKLLLVAGLFVVVVVYATENLVVILQERSALVAIYSRMFEAENQSLLENFATFPHVYPHMWGANIRPIAMVMGIPFMPSDSIVAHTWYNTYDVTSPSLFIADAWDGFSYAGVIASSVLAGAICRAIDVVFLAHGKSVVGIVVLGATFMGVFTLLTTALNTALLSGGLLLAPIVASALMAINRRKSRGDTMRNQADGQAHPS